MTYLFIVNFVVSQGSICPRFFLQYNWTISEDLLF